jgi:hypothetical protein
MAYGLAKWSTCAGTRSTSKLPPCTSAGSRTVARPLPHGADLTAVFNFIGQRISDTRVNFGVQDHSGNRVIGPLPLVGLEILPALMPLACAAGSGGQPKGSRSVRKSDPSGKAPYVPPYDPYGPGVRA